MKKLFIILIVLNISLFAKGISVIKFEGKNLPELSGKFSETELLKVLGIEYPPFFVFWRSDPTLDPSKITTYKEDLKKYFDSFGYYKTSIDANLKDDTITFNIDKGPQIKVKTYKFDGDKSIKKVVPIKEGKGFTTEDFKNSKLIMQRYLLENGYPKHSIKSKALIDRKRYRVDANATIKKGPLCTFGETHTSGRGRVDQEIIDEQIMYKKGDKYDVKKSELTYDNLYALGAYEYILIEPDLENNSTSLPINIRLKEAKNKSIRYSLGYDTDEGARGSIYYKDNNFLGNLKVLEAGVKLSQRGYEVSNRFYNPRIKFPLIPKRFTFENKIIYSKYKYESYEEEKLTDIITFGERAFNFDNFFGFEQFLGFMFEYSKVDSFLSDDIDGDKNYLINSLFYRANLDRRDSKLNANNGYLLSLYVERASKLLGSDIEYLKTILEYHHIKTIGRFTGSFKTRIGTIDSHVPIFKRFFTGGSSTNRGYKFQMLGNKDIKNNPLGGITLVDTLTELRYKVSKNFSSVLFYDSSQINNESYNFGGKFYGSYGAGIRYNTPIGPIRVDFGFPVDEDGYRFHFGIGQIF